MFEYQCLECGRKYKAMKRRCSGCGSSDIDLYVPPKHKDKEPSSEYFECPVCEKKKCVVSGTICADCFDKGARATVRWNR